MKNYEGSISETRQKEILAKIGQKVKFQRLELDMTQYDLAIKAGIGDNQIGRLERAEINISILSLYSIAMALNIDVGDLLSE